MNIVSAHRDCHPQPCALVPDYVWDGHSGRPKAGISVIVESNQIRQVRPSRRLPKRLKRIPLPGCTLIPGLIDCHVHFCDWMRPAFLAAGVTTIRDVGNDADWILERREFARQNPLKSPNILCCGPLLDGPNAHWPIMGRPHKDAKALVNSIEALLGNGVDAVKLYVNITQEQLIAAGRTAGKHRKHLLAHLGKFSAKEAAMAGVKEIEHLTGCSAAWKKSEVTELDALCAELLPHELVMCPTLVVWDRISRVCEPAFPHDPRRRWVHPDFLWAWEHYPSRFGDPAGRLNLQRSVVEMKRCLARMQEKRLSIIAGTDTPFPYLVPGFSMHDELELMVDAGLKPVDALRSATSRAAKVLGISDKVGRIKPGMRADLLAVRGDPTRDIRAISQVVQVVKHGELLDAERLRRMSRNLNRGQTQDPVSRDILGYIRKNQPR